MSAEESMNLSCRMANVSDTTFYLLDLPSSTFKPLLNLPVKSSLQLWLDEVIQRGEGGM